MTIITDIDNLALGFYARACNLCERAQKILREAATKNAERIAEDGERVYFIEQLRGLFVGSSEFEMIEDGETVNYTITFDRMDVVDDGLDGIHMVYNVCPTNKLGLDYKFGYTAKEILGPLFPIKPISPIDIGNYQEDVLCTHRYYTVDAVIKEAMAYITRTGYNTKRVIEILNFGILGSGYFTIPENGLKTQKEVDQFKKCLMMVMRQAIRRTGIALKVDSNRNLTRAWVCTYNPNEVDGARFARRALTLWYDSESVKIDFHLKGDAIDTIAGGNTHRVSIACGSMEAAMETGIFQLPIDRMEETSESIANLMNNYIVRQLFKKMIKGLRKDRKKMRGARIWTALGSPEPLKLDEPREPVEKTEKTEESIANTTGIVTAENMPNTIGGDIQPRS